MTREKPGAINAALFKAYRPGMSAQELAEKVGCSAAYVRKAKQRWALELRDTRDDKAK